VDDVIRIATDMITIYLLTPTAVTFQQDSKLELVDRIIGWRGDRLSIAAPEA
jgi:hypothetical protein